jgi:hypothetical protein
MSMTQLVIGAAFGFLVAQGLLYSLKRLLIWLQRGDLLARARAVRTTPAPTVVSALIRYAAPVGIGAALITLGVWGVNDYLAARSARNAEARLFDSASGPASESAPSQGRIAALAHTPPEAAADEAASLARDPYADPAFRVQRKVRRARGATSLRETLVQQSETRARNELLSGLQQHVQRSQYDCEAADRAGRYLKAGLDVWGFAQWQAKYFPVNNYRGATLEHCKGIKSVVAPALDLQSAMARENTPDPDR